MEKYLDHCETEFQKAQSISTMQIQDWYDIPYTDFFSKQNSKRKIPPTGIDIKDIKEICLSFSTCPKGIVPHQQVSFILLIKLIRISKSMNLNKLQIFIVNLLNMDFFLLRF